MILFGLSSLFLIILRIFHFLRGYSFIKIKNLSIIELHNTLKISLIVFFLLLYCLASCLLVIFKQCEDVCLQLLNIMARILRVLAIILLMAYALADQLDSDQFDPDYSYDDFMRHFGRTYEGVDREVHQAAFISNYAQLLRLKSEGKDVKINQRLDWTDQQNKDFLTYKPQNSGIPPSARPITANSLFASPTSFDWRSYGVVTPIKNQGTCGSCWAFSSTAQYESKLAIVSNGTMYNLAEQYVLKCQTNYSLGCNGGYPFRALQLIQNTGIPLETSYPYSPSTTYANICNDTTGRIKLNQTVNNVTFYLYQSLTVEQLQQDLVNYGPINVGVYASDLNFGYAGTSGLISCSSSNSPYSIDHAIVLVGYNTTHWFVKNSWGTNWGHNGFGYISKTSGNDCNIRQYVNQMQISNISPNPPPPPPPDPNSINLTITMTDSYGDGWQGNVMAIKQNGSVVGTFGGSFTSGYSSGPVYISVKNNLEFQIVVNNFGTSVSEVGFVVKAPNGTTIYQRNNGTIFSAGMIFKIVCLAGGCPATNYFTLTANMTDSYGDGWNSNILGIRQNGTIVGYFGNQFISGFSNGPLEIYVLGNLITQIFVHQLGTKTNEIGFTIKAPNGTTIHQRTTGTAFVYTTVFSSFCPLGGCVNTLLLTITMTDSYGDGWQGNVIGIRQNSTIVGTFGTNFRSGYSSGPVYITVRGDIEVQVIVTILGYSTTQVGFVIKAPNNTIIHQKFSGASFSIGTIFSTFCPVGGCQISPFFTLSISMTDSWGDGWNGNVLGIKQNGTVIGTFGGGFSSGSSYGPASITVQNNIEAQIVVTSFGCCTNQVGFVVRAPNGTIIYQRFSGVSYSSTIIFKTFCPVGGCPASPNVTYYLTLTDAYGDGWEGTVLAFKQNGTVRYTFGLSSGYSNSPVPYTFAKLASISVTVYTLGNYTNEIGFTLKNGAESIVTQRLAGSKFFFNSLLASFCAECINNSPVSIVSDSEQPKAPKTEIVDKETDQSTPATNEQGKGFKIATYVLSPVVAVFALVVGALIFKLVKVLQENKQLKQQKQENVAKQEPTKSKCNTSEANFEGSPEKQRFEQSIVAE